MDNPDNPMALPLTRAEEIRLWGDESAAAPELLAALETAAHRNDVTDAAIGAARAAITKATGEAA